MDFTVIRPRQQSHFGIAQESAELLIFDDNAAASKPKHRRIAQASVKIQAEIASPMTRS